MKKEMVGSIRILAKELTPVVKTKNGWKKTKADLEDAFQVINLFKKNKNLKYLVDNKNPRFLKGGITKGGKVFGARINMLPDGRKLDKAYSLFAKDLTIHDEKSNEHWDVIFKNPGGTYSYIYTLDKKEIATKKKYSSVKEFEKEFLKLNRVIDKKLKEGKDITALAMKTLFKTRMRVGGEVYFKSHNHQGLTTLKKRDIKIKGKKVTFRYVGKNGVPVEETETFSDNYVKFLKKILRRLKRDDFVFVREDGRPLKDTDFERAFKEYCGKEFYPHIVRSYYATKMVRDFLKKHKKPSKEEVRELFTKIAEKLGHKKFSKKDSKWVPNYTVTVHHYIEPKLVERVLNSKR